MSGFCISRRLIITLSLVILASFIRVFAGWSRTFGDPVSQWARVVQQTSDDGYVVTSVPYTLLKVDHLGLLEWQHTHDLDCWFIVQTQDEGYALCGELKDSVLLLKTDDHGNISWTRCYRGSYEDEGYCLQQLPDGGYVIVGDRRYDEAYDSVAVWVLRTDSLGDTIWTYTYHDAESWFVNLTSDSGFIVVANTGHYYGQEDLDILLFKLDGDGNLKWDRFFRWQRDEILHYVEETPDSGFFLAGWSESFRDADNPGSDILLMKTDRHGVMEWFKTYGDTASNYACSGQTSIGGGYVALATTTARGAGESDMWLLRTDFEGDTVWTRTYGGQLGERAFFIRQTRDTAYILTGYTESFGAGGKDVWLVKTDKDTTFIDTTSDAVTDTSIATSGSSWQATRFGPNIVLSFRKFTKGFRAVFFDAAGRKVDEVNIRQSSGEVVWGEEFPSGVYFVRIADGYRINTAKAVLIK